MQSNLPFIEKYRPKYLKDIVGHDNIKRTLKGFLKQNNLAHLLLYGPPGSGKTSIIMAIARELYGDHKTNILELNASDERGISTVRNRIKQFASTGQLFNKKLKLVILDEADMMTTDAQMALRCMVEKYSKTTRFCFICNCINNIIEALQSRCMKLVISSISQSDIKKRINMIIKKEKIDVNKEFLNIIIKNTNGDMRDILNVLERIKIYNHKKKIKKQELYSFLNIAHSQTNLIYKRILLESDYHVIYNYFLKNYINKGISITEILPHLVNFILNSNLKQKQKATIISTLSDIDFQLIYSCNQDLLLSKMVSCIIIGRQ